MSAVRQLTVPEAREFLDKTRLTQRTVLDVRQDFEYQEGHLPGAKWIPLPELSERLGELDRSKPVLAYCRSGVRSLAAANLLAGQGFAKVLSMNGGVMAWDGEQAVGPHSLGFPALLPATTPAELLERAWGMELVLEGFYAGLAAASADPELAALYARLAGFEERHRRVLAEQWTRLGGADLSGFEARARAAAAPATLEGGLEAGDYLGPGGPPENAAEALELAMAVEAQALDLYSRKASAEIAPELRDALLLLAEEERAHLKVLGLFLDGRGRF